MARARPLIDVPPAGLAPMLFLLVVRAVLFLRDRFVAWRTPA